MMGQKKQILYVLLLNGCYEPLAAKRRCKQCTSYDLKNKADPFQSPEEHEAALATASIAVGGTTIQLSKMI